MNEVEVNNAETNLASIRSDTIQAAKDLTELLQKKKLIEGEIEEAEDKLASTKEACATALKELEDERSRMRMERKAHIDWTERSKKELEVVKSQKSAAMSELKRLNEWIFSGEATVKELEAKLKDLHEQENSKKSLESDIIAVRAEKEEAEQERNSVRLETRLAVDEAENALIKARDELAKAETRLKEATDARIKEEESYTTTRNDHARIKEDLAIYVARVKEKYEETFPGHTIKL